jgi:anti-sigma28 factor (negative regulator of flagellin synthesis)
MKIDNPLLSQVSTGGSAQTGAVTQGEGGSGGRNRLDVQADRVQLSGLSEALRGLNVEDPERTAEVRKVAASVQAGVYQIDAVQLGRKILSDSLEIL